MSIGPNTTGPQTYYLCLSMKHDNINGRSGFDHITRSTQIDYSCGKPRTEKADKIYNAYGTRLSLRLEVSIISYRLG